MGTRVIYLQDIYAKIADIKEVLNDKLSHPYLLKHLSSPKIDEDKLILFIALFENIPLQQAEKDNYIITAMLVQTALDTHEDVTTADRLGRDQFVQRQLTVLAGDYFSGLYYALLSDMKDIEMVRTLATAIKEINEHKIRLYDYSQQDFSRFINSLMIIETALFQHILKHFNMEPFTELTEKYLSCKRLYMEKRRFETDAPTVFHVLEKSSKNTIELAGTFFKDMCNTYFEEAISLLHSTLGISPGTKAVLISRLQSYGFKDAGLYNSYAEEGL
nr:heptaprenyl diphosphate synthase component 1 [Metabacillus lacus]